MKESPNVWPTIGDEEIVNSRASGYAPRGTSSTSPSIGSPGRTTVLSPPDVSMTSEATTSAGCVEITPVGRSARGTGRLVGRAATGVVLGGGKDGCTVGAGSRCGRSRSTRDRHPTDVNARERISRTAATQDTNLLQLRMTDTPT